MFVHLLSKKYYNMKNAQILRNSSLLDKLSIKKYCRYSNAQTLPICTIYAIQNKETGEIYIGQTINSPEKRWSGHYIEAKNNWCQNYFHQAILEYGWDNFEKFVIWQYRCRSKHEDAKLILNWKETFFIRLFKTTNTGIGYNSTPGGNSGYIKTGNLNFQYYTVLVNNSYNKKPVLQFDFNKNLIKEWDSAANASRSLHIAASQIADCCNRGQHSCAGFHWVWKDEFVEDYFEKFQIKSNAISNEKAILQYDFIGNLIKEWGSASEAAVFHNWDKSMISGAANGKHKQAKGYIWIYKKDYSDEELMRKLDIVKKLPTYNSWIKQTVSCDNLDDYLIVKDKKPKKKYSKKKVSELTEEQAEHLRETSRLRYSKKINNMSDEELQKFRESERKRHKKINDTKNKLMTKEERDFLNKKKREAYANMDPIEKKKLLEKANERTKNNYNKLSTEERQRLNKEKRAKLKEKFNQMSPEQQAAIKAKWAEYARKYREKKKLENDI